MRREAGFTPRKTHRPTRGCPGTKEARQTATLNRLVHENPRVLA
jgi:hypothetical protein